MRKPRLRTSRISLLLVLLAVGYAATLAASAPVTAAASSARPVQVPAQVNGLAGLPSVPRTQTLVVSPWYLASTIANPTTFNIYAPGDLSQHGIGNKTIYEGLAYYDPTTGKNIPWLATSWAYSDNYKTLTVHLRKGVTWSDGVPFTA